MKHNITTYEGLVKKNPYGNWSDVDHGMYVGGDKMCDSEAYSIFDEFIGRRVRVTIQVLPEDSDG